MTKAAGPTIAVCTMAIGLGAALGFVPGYVATELQSDLDISRAQVGLIVSLYFGATGPGPGCRPPLPAPARIPAPISLPRRDIRRPEHGPRPTLADVRTACERDTVRAALARSGGCRAKAARELGLTRQGLRKTMRRLDL